MKAVICPRYGSADTLQICDVEKPAPKADEVLIKIHASSVHIGDTKIRAFKPGMGPVKDFLFKPIMRILLGFRGPRRKIMGMELAGEVEAVGAAVTQFKPGDTIFGSTGMYFGAYAEYVSLPEKAILTAMPSNLSYAQAATVPNGAMTALLILQKGKIRSGRNVLIYGASGSVGTFAVQLAIQFGAAVTAVCSTANIEMVRALGAGTVIDYTCEDFSEKGESYDLIFDTVGKASPEKCRKALTSNGIYLNVLTASGGIKQTKKDLNFIKESIENGYLTPVIDRTYALDQIVEAHRYVEQGHKRGNVALQIIP